MLNPWNVDALSEIERETGKNIYNILQLRLHPSVIELKNKIENGPEDKIYDIDLSYITARGHWYYTSWKGDIAKSGGVASNIGVYISLICSSGFLAKFKAISFICTNTIAQPDSFN